MRSKASAGSPSQSVRKMHEMQVVAETLNALKHEAGPAKVCGIQCTGLCTPPILLLSAAADVV